MRKILLTIMLMILKPRLAPREHRLIRSSRRLCGQDGVIDIVGQLIRIRNHQRVVMIVVACGSRSRKRQLMVVMVMGGQRFVTEMLQIGVYCLA